MRVERKASPCAGARPAKDAIKRPQISRVRSTTPNRTGAAVGIIVLRVPAWTYIQRGSRSGTGTGSFLDGPQASQVMCHMGRPSGYPSAGALPPLEPLQTRGRPSFRARLAAPRGAGLASPNEAPLHLVKQGVVGALDGDRAQAILEALLAAVQRSRCSRVILDVTGVDAIEADTAEPSVHERLGRADAKRYPPEACPRKRPKPPPGLTKTMKRSSGACPHALRTAGAARGAWRGPRRCL